MCLQGKERAQMVGRHDRTCSIVVCADDVSRGLVVPNKGERYRAGEVRPLYRLLGEEKKKKQEKKKQEKKKKRMEM